MDMKETVSNYYKEIKAFRRDMHQHPELSMKEYRTSQKVAQQLKQLGLEVQEGVGQTGVVAILEGAHSGKTLALRADMDALPVEEDTDLSYMSQTNGVMHACGHDFHTAILLGTAKVLTQYKGQLYGRVKFVFQPGEERALGAQAMIDEGVLEDPKVDHIACLHCWPELPVGKIGIRRGAIMASSDHFEIVIRGEGGHAAYPHKCVDPIMIAAHVIDALQTIVSRELPPYEPAVVTVSRISGGTADNIIAPSVTLGGTVRTMSLSTQAEMSEKVERIVEHIAQAHRGEAEIMYKIGTPPLINDEELLQVFEHSAVSSLGRRNVCELPFPALGAEDFSNYLKHVPGMLFRLGTNNEDARSKLPLHNPSLIFDEKAIEIGMQVMSQFAIDYLSK